MQLVPSVLPARITPLLVTASLAFGALAAPVTADALFDGSKARVNLSSKLVMLSQAIGSAGCRINAGIDVDTARADLIEAQTDFNTILNGLEVGGSALGIPSAEKHSVVLKSIEAVHNVWDPIDAATATLISGSGDTAGAAATIGAKNLELMEAAKILASDISGKYSNPRELTQSDAMALHFAGRQRMLGHQMAKEVCGIATAQPAFGTTEGLEATVKLFDVSLSALQNGMPNAGINEPPTEAIRSELAAVSSVWEGESQDLNVFTQNATPSPENVVSVSTLSHEIMTDMSNVVTLYMLATPGQDDVYRVPLRAYAEEELTKWLQNAELIKAIRGQNQAHASLTQTDIDNLDKTWRAEAKSEAGGPLIDDLLSRPTSGWMRDKQSETADFVTEVFAMDNRGLNVAQNVETSDFWQGDEAKWQETIGNESGQIHISEVEYDESTGVYQSQVSMPVIDPETGELIGAVTFGINVQSLL